MACTQGRSSKSPRHSLGISVASHAPGVGILMVVFFLVEFLIDGSDINEGDRIVFIRCKMETGIDEMDVLLLSSKSNR